MSFEALIADLTFEGALGLMKNHVSVQIALFREFLAAFFTDMVLQS
jgi:hypothetical protein